MLHTIITYEWMRIWGGLEHGEKPDMAAVTDGLRAFRGSEEGRFEVYSSVVHVKVPVELLKEQSIGRNG